MEKYNKSSTRKVSGKRLVKIRVEIAKDSLLDPQL